MKYHWWHSRFCSWSKCPFSIYQVFLQDSIAGCPRITSPSRFYKTSADLAYHSVAAP